MTLRLSKRMAELGICSRREADYMIEHGWVLVNGAVVDKLGSKIELKDKIEISKAGKLHLDQKVSIVMYKPVGYVCHASEDKYPHVFDLLSFENCAEEPKRHQKAKGLAPVGRLDIDSKGLLILSQDGTLAKKVIQADSSIKKTYVVKIDGSLNTKELALLEAGKAWPEANVLKPLKVKLLNDGLYEIILTEGKNRQIRHMMEFLGKRVLMLKRIQIANLSLDGLEEGEWRRITDKEKQILMSL